jgi:hypothetical protein
MARYFYSLKLMKLWPNFATALVGVQTTGMKGTPRGWVQRVGNLTDHRRSGLSGVVHFWNGIQQHAGIGMSGIRKQ